MKKFPIQQFGIIILAAGESRRMQQPKQLLEFNGQSLVRRAAWTALSTDAAFVVVVVGAYHREVYDEFADLPVTKVKNRQWEQGMASSLRCGIQYAMEKKKWKDALLIMPCDMPLIDKEHIAKLVAAQQASGLPIAASKNKQYTGMPALFHRSMFADLMSLEGDAAPRQMIANHSVFTTVVDFEQGGVNIDTIQDYTDLLQQTALLPA